MSKNIDLAAELALLENRFTRDLAALRRRVEADATPEPLAEASALDVVITFSKWFGNRNGTRYTYAAIRPAHTGRWSVTGKGVLTSVPWKRVVELIREDEGGTTELALESITVRG